MINVNLKTNRVKKAPEDGIHNPEVALLFRKLNSVKEQLGWVTWDRIRRLIVTAKHSSEEAEYLQGRRRDLAAGYLGMSRDDYEEHLSNPSHKPKRRMFKSDTQVIKDNLFD